MRKYILAIIAICLLASVANARFPRGKAIVGLQITCDISTGVATGATGPCASPTAAVCTGDQTVVNRVTSITAGTSNVNVTVNTFSAGDVGKFIDIPGAGPGSGDLKRTIGSVTDPQNIVLSGGNANVTLSSVPTNIGYGSDVALPLKQFNTWAVANQGTKQVVLTMPASSNCWFGSQQGYLGTYPSGTSNNFNAFGNGIKDLVVEGANSTWDSAGGSPFYIGGGPVCHKGLAETTGCSARINTVSSGSSTVTLTSASYAAGYTNRFPVGTWMLVGGLNPQLSNNNATTGYPQNLVYFDWRQVTAVCTNTVGCVGSTVLTLNAPITNTLLDTWPAYISGNASEADPGGPAAIWAMPTEWSASIEVKNLTMNQSGQISSSGRTVTLRNVNFPGAGGNCGIFPSQTETWSVYTGNWNQCIMETDKMVSNQIMDNVTIRKIDFQSSATTNLTITNSFLGVGGVSGEGLSGTARFNNISDTQMGTFKPGSFAYGTSSQVVCTRCNVAIFAYDGGIAQTFSEYTMTGGVLSFSHTFANNSAPASRIFAPIPSNTYYVIGGSFSGPIGLFNGSAITDGATDTSVQTNEVGGFPSFTSASGATCCANLRSHPAPKFTNDSPNPASDPTFLATSVQNGATPLAPQCEFSGQQYAPASGNSSLGLLCVTGRITSITINVTQAYNGSNALTLNVLGVGGQETVDQAAGPPWASVVYNPRINTKVTGTRVITSSGVTCNGVVGAGTGCSGDVGLSLTSAAQWIKQGFNPSMGGTVYIGHTLTPLFTITAQMNQGVVP